MMDKAEAHRALDAVAHTNARIAAGTRWPFWRHAAFGLAEASVVFGLSLPAIGLVICVLLGFAIVIGLFIDDRRRYGMFVSGWHGSRPKLLLLGMVAVVAAMAVLSFMARGAPAPAPQAVIATIVTLVTCTAGSLWWQSLYRQELAGGAR